MKEGKLWLVVPLLIVTAALFYFAFNSSYERSLQAKYYYATGSYDRAFALAREAFELDPYNRMAATVMTQSQTALKYVDYIKQAKEYSAKISSMGAAETIGAAERAKMKLMCEVMIESFAKISLIRRDGRSIVLDAALVEEADAYNRQFRNLYEKITQTL